MPHLLSLKPGDSDVSICLHTCVELPFSHLALTERRQCDRKWHDFSLDTLAFSPGSNIFSFLLSGPLSKSYVKATPDGGGSV